ARTLANQYAQILGNVFTHGMKPMEVEILVAEVGLEPGVGDQIFHIMYDGTVVDHADTCVLGGDSEAIAARLTEGFTDGADLASAVKFGAKAIAGADRVVGPSDLEVAVLERGNGRRCFRRLDADEVTGIFEK
ncbi:MAG: proteasome subunit alpha, partial [Ilumatobacteraceae bacterium]